MIFGGFGVPWVVLGIWGGFLRVILGFWWVFLVGFGVGFLGIFFGVPWGFFRFFCLYFWVLGFFEDDFGVSRALPSPWSCSRSKFWCSWGFGWGVLGFFLVPS